MTSKKCIRHLISLLLFFLLEHEIINARTIPVVGEKIPAFKLNVAIPSKQVIKAKSVKGKWLIMDFWALTCKSCIASFGKIEKLHSQFKDKIDIVLVGREDGEHNRGIRQFYETLAGRKGFTMMAAFDSVLFDRWEVGALPYILVIDPQGILRYITDGRDMTAEKLTNLVAAKPVTFYRSTLSAPNYEPSVAIAPEVRAAGGLLSGSIITRWNGERQRGGIEVERFVPGKEDVKGGWYASMVPLYALYNYAYIGSWNWVSNDTARYAKFAPFPILSVADSSAFDHDYVNDVGRGTYCYFLSIPEERINIENLMAALQQDLKRTFGFDVAVEVRLMPVLKLVCTGSQVANLKSKGGDPVKKPVPGGIIIQNSHVSNLARILAYRLNNPKMIPIIDGTGIKTPIDITLGADMTDLEDIRRALNRFGLDLVRDVNQMKTIVISDSDKRR